nr:MAG TPA: hypothetical protein [Caudoviricetes sp.]
MYKFCYFYILFTICIKKITAKLITVISIFYF